MMTIAGSLPTTLSSTQAEASVQLRGAMYEDAGDTYDYESGQDSEIQFWWNDAGQHLTIGARTGSDAGMPTASTFNIVRVGLEQGSGVGASTPDRVVDCDGADVVIRLE